MWCFDIVVTSLKRLNGSHTTTNAQTAQNTKHSDTSSSTQHQHHQHNNDTEADNEPCYSIGQPNIFRILFVLWKKFDLVFNNSHCAMRYQCVTDAGLLLLVSVDDSIGAVRCDAVRCDATVAIVLRWEHLFLCCFFFRFFLVFFVILKRFCQSDSQHNKREKQSNRWVRRHLFQRIASNHVHWTDRDAYKMIEIGGRVHRIAWNI